MKTKSNLKSVKEILNEVKKNSLFYGGVYFGHQFNSKYANNPKGKNSWKWEINELTEEMLNLKFPNNQWFIESGDLMFESI